MKHRPRSRARQGPSNQQASWLLMVFAKAPIPGQVKTRLCPPLTEDEAATLHGSVVLDTLERSKTVREFDRILACAPSPDHPFFQTVGTKYSLPLWQQVGIDLGARMAQAFQMAFDHGYQGAMLVGTDLPTLGTTIYHQALKALSTHDLVLGPTVDGGYYLIGLRKPTPSLFEEIPWSTQEVCVSTQRKAQQLGLSIGLLPRLRDIDTIEDLHQFTNETQGPEKKNFSTRTIGVLQALAKRLATRQHDSDHDTH
ncbi:MAG: DUF2064 domain-containing protein [Nitrospirales bacterium]|nr:DUF2064 domain-containing protein [Nitrospirales bacterium]